MIYKKEIKILGPLVDKKPKKPPITKFESMQGKLSEKEIEEKKAAYQSGQAYRNGSDDVIDVNYVEKDENE